MSSRSIDNPEISSREIYESINGPPPGKFLDTTHGTTHYQLEGPNDAKLLVILQHGLGADTSRWDRIAKDLLLDSQNNKNRVKVLRYDLYDRGYSETNPKKYPITTIGKHPLQFTQELYVEQLYDVLKGLKLDQMPIIHCGHSLGGLIGISYAAASKAAAGDDDANMIKGLILVDAVCLPASKPITAKLADLPIIGDLLVSYFGAKSMMKFVTSSFVNPQYNSKVISLISNMEQNVYTNPRYFASIRSTNTYCKGFVGSAETEFRTICSNGSKSIFPIHFIWGKNDQSVPYEHCLELKRIAIEECNRNEEEDDITEISFDGMPHSVFDDDAKPTECSKSICDFVQNVLRRI